MTRNISEHRGLLQGLESERRVLQGLQAPSHKISINFNNFQYFHGDFSRNCPIMLQLCSFWGLNFQYFSQYFTSKINIKYW